MRYLELWYVSLYLLSYFLLLLVTMVKATGAKLDFEDINLKDGSIDKVSVRAIFPKKKTTVRTSRDSAVKINSDLLVEVEEFINLEENKFRYVNRKQFIDVAVADYLKRCGDDSN